MKSFGFDFESYVSLNIEFYDTTDFISNKQRIDIT